MFPVYCDPFSGCLDRATQALRWCGRQVTRITSPLPHTDVFREIGIRAAIVFSIAIPLLGLLSRYLGIASLPPIPKAALSAPKIPPERRILDGYGEYLLRLQEGGGAVDLETFRQAFQIIEAHHPGRWMAENPTSSPTVRKISLRRQIQQINPQLELIFIPKTLYELFFIRQSIDEDLQKVQAFIHQNPEAPRGQACKQTVASKNSWLNEIPPDEPPSRFQLHTLQRTDREIELAHRLNGAFSQLWNEKNLGAALTFGQIQTLLEEQIDFLQNLYVGPPFPAIQFVNCVTPGPSSHFATESHRGSLTPMGLSSPLIADILRKATQIECSTYARGKILLYRGGPPEENSPFIEVENEVRPQGLPYGTTLFSQALNYGGNAPFYSMRKEGHEGYALLIDPTDSTQKDLFFTPALPAITELFSYGDAFFGRLKIPVRDNEESEVPSHLRSPFSPKRLTALFQEQMEQQAFLLKSA